MKMEVVKKHYLKLEDQVKECNEILQEFLKKIIMNVLKAQKKQLIETYADFLDEKDIQEIKDHTFKVHNEIVYIEKDLAKN